MYFSIRGGTDGIGLDFENVDGVFADNIIEARESAVERLRSAGYALQADRGLFTVHGHRDWVLRRVDGRYRVEPTDEPGIVRPIDVEIGDADGNRETITVGRDITVNNTGTGTVHVAENMTFNNLQIGR